MDARRCAAVEAAEFGVRINAVAPSIAIHAFLKSRPRRNCSPNSLRARAFAAAPEPWEPANVMVFLASDYDRT